ncbi:MAG: 3-dehydroquinate synthase [Pseudomonadota bacterium]
MTKNADIVRVELAGRGYDVVIGDGLLADCGERIRAVLRRPRAIVVTDAHVGPLYADRVMGALAAAGVAADLITVPAGEASKDFATLERICSAALDRKLERGDGVVALGGGVIGDLAGFAAAVLLRGVDYIQAPTTLLAQVDSAVGGKTGIDVPQGKNLIGAFHQPKLVIADIGALDSLPDRELRAGYAEVAKYGLLGDADFFAELERDAPALVGGDGALRRWAVRRSVEAKAAIVVEDEREAGRRALLNLGHTFAHAFEAYCGYDGRLAHGEAVAAGMATAFRLSEIEVGCPAEHSARVRRHLRRVGLPVSPAETAAADAPIDALIDLMAADKKVQDGAPRFILAEAIGAALPPRPVERAAVRAALSAAFAQGD